MPQSTSKKFRIALLVKNFIAMGGAERYAYEIAQGLISRGHRIHLYTWKADADLSKDMRVHIVPNRFRFSSATNLVSFSSSTSQMLQREKYDIIHTHDRGYMPQDISTLHNFTFKSGFDKHSKFRKIDLLYLNPRSLMHLWLERHQMRAPHLVAVSEILKQDAARQYGRSDNVNIIEPGVDTTFFHPDWIVKERNDLRKKERIPDNEMVILFIGNGYQRKGLDQLLPAIGEGMRLLVVGQDDKIHYYDSVAKQQNLQDRVDFKGYCLDIRPYFAMADVVAVPALSEAFGMSILEGMSCGLPVITSSNAGISSLIKNGINGFSSTCHEELHQLLRKLRDADLRKSIGYQARVTAELYSWTRATDEYEKIYTQIVSQKR